MRLLTEPIPKAPTTARSNSPCTAKKSGLPRKALTRRFLTIPKKWLPTPPKRKVLNSSRIQSQPKPARRLPYPRLGFSLKNSSPPAKPNFLTALKYCFIAALTPRQFRLRLTFLILKSKTWKLKNTAKSHTEIRKKEVKTSSFRSTAKK